MPAIIIGTRDRVEVLCVKCLCNDVRADGGEADQRYCFNTTHGEYIWDVEKAIKLVAANADERIAAGRFVRFDHEQMAVWINQLHDDALDEPHIGHVDPSIPGIMTQAWDCTTDAPAAVLIDGTHRMVRCLIERRSFAAFLLTHEESMSCVIKMPALSADKLRRMAAEEAFPVAQEAV